MANLKNRIKNSITRLGKYRELAAKGYLFKLISAIFTDFLRLPFYLIPHKGVKVVEEDWDYLIILDACRFDTFKELNDIEGKLEKRRGLGSFTTEWGNKNFDGYYDDIVYVSGNPRVCDSMIKGFKGSEHFHDVIDVWDEGWDEELETVPPGKVTPAVLEVRKKYPDKRLIIHYMQPHCPFVIRTDLNKFLPLMENPDKSNIIRRKFLKFLASKSSEIRGLWKHTDNPWNAVKKEIIEIEEFREGHLENLRVVLKEVERLVENLDEKTIITSDHGELFGEFWMYGHPDGIRVKPLVEVPWFEVEMSKKVQ
ncbi:hypothetical protein AKJ53_00895 [candidate division MSBL1 archaeon SCGC-AAA382F02]|uniref:Sulfatase N-terminal domain-containing protein n=1 Tax=candidate division MSBL1 archaeon SCGC-AAA382F02 TaxID=1698282 RepID=A0A133VIH4_9EURY|nr:hypothetical protein AKJ53_00895 [candidate division MSBL1 archaeon SCGC-AAA382F02]